MTIGNETLVLQQIAEIISISVGLVFAFAAATKVADLSGTVAAFRRYEIAPQGFSGISVSLLIFLESVIAASHVTGIAIHVVAPATLILLVAFLIVTGITIRQRTQRPCLCFGASNDEMVDMTTVLRISLIVLAEAFLSAYFGAHEWVQTANAQSELAKFATAGACVLLIGWALSIPGLRRAIHVVNS